MFTETNIQVDHIEIDITDASRLLYCGGNSLQSTDGTEPNLLLGSADESGYREAAALRARFNRLSGFTQINETMIITVDQRNHCLRAVDRPSLSTHQFVGKCHYSGDFADGIDARFGNPHSVVHDLTSANKLLVSDEGNNAIRQVDITTRLTTTIVKSSILRWPIGIAFDTSRENLLISSIDVIRKYDIQSHNLTNLTGSIMWGFRDGRLAEALFNRPRDILPLSADVILVADKNNERLRIINLTDDSVSSLCAGDATERSISSQRCELVYPVSLCRKSGGTIYIGGINGIWTLKCE